MKLILILSENWTIFDARDVRGGTLPGPRTVDGSTVHLYAGAVVFAALPAAGVMLARRQRRLTGRNAMTVALTVISVFSGLLSTALILNRLPGVIGMPELMLPPGILQRAAGAVEIVLLAVAAATVLRSATRSIAKVDH